MTDIMQQINEADAEQIDYLLEAVMKRKRALYPDWEIIYYAHKRGESDNFQTLLTMCNRKE